VTGNFRNAAILAAFSGAGKMPALRSLTDGVVSAKPGSAPPGAGRQLVAHRYAYFAFLCGSSLRIRIHNM